MPKQPLYQYHMGFMHVLSHCCACCSFAKSEQQRACAGDVPVAKVRLGFLYEEGNGVEQDLQVGLIHLRQACNLCNIAP